MYKKTYGDIKRHSKENKKRKEKLLKENFDKMSYKELAILLDSHISRVRALAAELGLTRRNFVNELLDGEEFRSMDPIGFGRYEISNKGRIRRIKDNILMKQNTTYDDGYHILRLVDNKGKRTTNYLFVHKLVAQVFIHNDDPQYKTEVNHKDGNKDNNTVENLEWITPRDNKIHAIKTGLRVGKFTSTEDINKICKLLQEDKTRREISDAVPNVSRRTIRDIANKKSWINISKNYNF